MICQLVDLIDGMKFLQESRHKSFVFSASVSEEWIWDLQKYEGNGDLSDMSRTDGRRENY
jgi:hypothetical protein